MEYSNPLCDENENIFSDILKYGEPAPELERVKQGIQNIISQKENVNRENGVLKIHQLTISQLNGQNAALKERLQKIEAVHQQNQNVFPTIPKIFVGTSSYDIHNIDRSSPDGQETDFEYKSLSSQKNCEILSLEEKITTLKSELSCMANEKKELLEKHE